VGWWRGVVFLPRSGNKSHQHSNPTVQQFSDKPLKLTTIYSTGQSETKFPEIDCLILNERSVKDGGVPDLHQAPEYENTPPNCVAVYKSKNFFFFSWPLQVPVCKRRKLIQPPSETCRSCLITGNRRNVTAYCVYRDLFAFTGSGKRCNP